MIRMRADMATTASQDNYPNAVCGQKSNFPKGGDLSSVSALFFSVQDAFFIHRGRMLLQSINAKIEEFFFGRFTATLRENRTVPRLPLTVVDAAATLPAIFFSRAKVKSQLERYCSQNCRA